MNTEKQEQSVQISTKMYLISPKIHQKKLIFTVSPEEQDAAKARETERKTKTLT